MTAESKKERKLKGVKRGGTMFPRINLEKAVIYAKKLVARTHNGPQPESVILPGVFGSSTGAGKIRRSALKQFGLLDGDASGYYASQLAKDIAAAPSQECAEKLKTSLLMPPVFKTLFETFQDDETSTARIKQQAMNHRVHIESADECVELFCQSVVYAGLGVRSGDILKLQKGPPAVQSADEDIAAEETEEETPDEGLTDAGGVGENPDHPNLPSSSESNAGRGPRRSGTVNVSINIDPTMDPEKLEKHLKLLRAYRVFY